MSSYDETIRLGRTQWRRLHSKKDGTTAAERAEAKRRLRLLRKRAAAGDLAARLLLLANAVPRRRQ
jgi:hypothetical protein